MDGWNTNTSFLLGFGLPIFRCFHSRTLVLGSVKCSFLGMPIKLCIVLKSRFGTLLHLQVLRSLHMMDQRPSTCHQDVGCFFWQIPQSISPLSWDSKGNLESQGMGLIGWCYSCSLFWHLTLSVVFFIWVFRGEKWQLEWPTTQTPPVPELASHWLCQAAFSSSMPLECCCTSWVWWAKWDKE